MIKLKKNTFTSSPIGNGSLVGNSADLKPIYNRTTSLKKGRTLWKFVMTSFVVLAIATLSILVLNTNNTQAGRSPGDWLNQSFWDQNPSDGNIIYALYGDGTPGSTPYNQNWTGGCIPNTVTGINAGSLPTVLNANTIYLISSGSYTLNSQMTMGECSAIVGNGDINITANHYITPNKKNIIDNLIIDTSSSYGIYLSGAFNNTINGVEVESATSDGIKIQFSDYNTINNSSFHDNLNGLYILGSNHNIVEYSQFYNNTDGLKIEGTNGTTTATGLDSSYNTINNSMFFNNSGNGVFMKAGNGGNGGDGDDGPSCSAVARPGKDGLTGKKGGTINNNIFSNSILFNNNSSVLISGGNGGVGGNGGDGTNACTSSDGRDGGDGGTGGIGGDIKSNTISNTIVYNNQNGITTNIGTIGGIGTDGYDGFSSTYAGGVGGDGGQGGIEGEININIKNMYIYNNNTGMNFDSNGNTAEGTITMFDNTSNTGGSHSLSGSSFSWDINNHSISYDRMVNPRNLNGIKLFNGLNYSAMRGYQSAWSGYGDIRYLYGKDIVNQIQPEVYSGTSLINYGIAGLNYDTSKYIAEKVSYLPSDDENLIQYYYGPNSEFTQNWDANNCSLGAFDVKHINSSNFNTEVAGTNTMGHTIYVLEDGTYQITSDITIQDNCVAIVAKNTGAKIVADYSSINSIIKIEQKDNMIFDGLRLDGNSQKSDYGINLVSSGMDACENNTINNIRSYDQNKNGIMMGTNSQYNTIMNTQTFNNNDYGIEIYYVGNYNVINNSISYNNSKYGIRFGNGSKFNTINNGQFFNNEIGGVFADLTTQQNIINNVHAYNNTDYGLNFKRSSGNTLNNIYAYNNDIGINMVDTSCINNTYNGDLTFFDNTGGNLSGTNGNDTYLIAESANGTLSWQGGNINSGSYNMDCIRSTNPRDDLTRWMLSGDINCSNKGVQNSWSFSFVGNQVDYMFGNQISKQIAPVGYDNSSIVNLTNQFDPNAYVGEINPIIRTDPGTISITSDSGFANLELNTVYQLNVNFDKTQINHPFDIDLDLDPSNATGYIAVKTGGASQWTNVGTLINNVSNITELALMITTLSGYDQVLTGEIYIGTSQYGNGFELFSLTNKHDPTPPSMSWTKNIDNNTGGTNTWQVNFSGAYSTNAWYDYVTGANDCNSGIIYTTQYMGTTIDAVQNSQYATFNDKYVCVYVLDTVNNQYITGLSNQINILQDTPTISRDENISQSGIWEGDSNTWKASFSGIYDVDARISYVTGANDCNSGIISNNPISYNGSQVDISNYTPGGLENKYVCIYVKDNVNGKYTTSLSNQIKISKLDFVDDVEIGPSYSDIIEINFENLYNYGYKRINTGSECTPNMTGLMTYQNPIMISNDLLFNNKYICAYGEDSNGSGKYILSAHDINISDYSSRVDFLDDINDQWNTGDTISVYFSGAISFDQKKYKRVDVQTECNNTNNMNNYTGDIFVNNSNLNGKYFCLYSREQSSGIENYLVSTNKLKIDDIDPEIPTIDSPVNNEDIYFLILEVSNLVDNESGISGFEYKIAESATFLDVVSDGIYYTTGNSMIPNFNENTDKTYAIKIKAIDSVGNKSDRSNPVEFDYKKLNNFEFDYIENAEPGELYTSNEITVDGLDTNQAMLASINYGILYRNGEPKGSSTLVQNDDELKIEMFASEDYDDEVETELVIGNRSVTWQIKTMNDGYDDELNCDLSNSQKLNVAAIFNSIVNMYDSDQLAPFLITMQSMLEDNIILGSDEDSVCKMQYLLQLIDNELDESSNESNTHTTPNCKEYAIDYSNSKEAYYSPDMMVRTYFGSRDELGRYLDSKNPGDCHVNTYGNTISYDNTDPDRHIAPNGKVYDIESSNIGYTSPDFTYVKYFASIGELRKYIDTNNPAVLVWDHDVDPDFTPVIHTAPNGKTYKIYKTNRGYMSYKLLNVRYYSSLQELQNYIDINNK